MNQLEARKAIAQRWLALWPGLSGGVAFTFDEDQVSETISYARISIRFEDSEQRTMGQPGNRKYERPGLIVVELYVPPGDGTSAGGTRRIDELTVACNSIFEGARFGMTGGGEEGITTHAAIPGRTEAVGQHIVGSVGYEFEYYETR